MDREERQPEGSVSAMLQWLYLLGIVTLFVGIVIVVIATFVQGFQGSASSGGIVIVGPFPIVFGSGPESPWLITLGAVLTIIAVAGFVVLNRRARSKND